MSDLTEILAWIGQPTRGQMRKQIQDYIEENYLEKDKVRKALGETEIVPENFETVLPERQHQMNYKGRMWARNDLRKYVRKELEL